MDTLPARKFAPSSLCLAAVAACAGLVCSQAQATGEPVIEGTAYRGGVVSVANPHGAEAGARILEQGGNAIDAAVAIAYALNVVEPQSAGIGGGGFMMFHLAQWGLTFTLDTREKAPALATRDMFVGVPSASLQGVAVGVPGMVRGTAMAVQFLGRKSLAQVMAPAIELADQGFAATPRFVSSPACTTPTSRALNSPESAAYFCPGGAAIPAGTVVTNKPLAETFRLIARHGPDCFYKHMPDKGCDIALGIVEGQKFARSQAGSKGGSMTLADLEAYQPAFRPPIEGSYRGYKIKAMGPPSSGALTVLQILKMLERFPLGDTNAGFGYGSVKTLNVMADAMRLAFADRADWMADADFVPVPAKGLLDSTYVAVRGGPIVPGVMLAPNPLPGDPRPYQTAGLEPRQAALRGAPTTGPENGTTHFSVVDRWGNFVSYTNTIESGYGIGVFAGYKRNDGTLRNHGFLLNNELTDFNTTPSTNRVSGEVGYNDVQPGKRPRSSMSPTMLFTPEGKPVLAYGSPGGATIINSVVNITINLVDHGMQLQPAIDAARISVASSAPSITLETARLPAGTGPATEAALRALGYTVGTGDVGSVQIVAVDPRNGKQYGAADNRREGTVIGLPRH
ncbi:MAG: gamma-glutamyltransferase [Rubrivivax sp.]|nr:gamma-glutamyltransferase [Rubrivivax sp.]